MNDRDEFLRSGRFSFINPLFTWSILQRQWPYDLVVTQKKLTVGRAGGRRCDKGEGGRALLLGASYRALPVPNWQMRQKDSVILKISLHIQQLHKKDEKESLQMSTNDNDGKAITDISLQETAFLFYPPSANFTFLFPSTLSAVIWNILYSIRAGTHLIFVISWLCISVKWSF